MIKITNKMAEIEENIEELKCLDLNERIAEKSKTMKNIDKNQLSYILFKKDFIWTTTGNQNLLFKVTCSIESEINNFLKKIEEANMMINDNFTISKDPKNKGKEKESLTEILKSIIQRSKQRQANIEKDDDNASIYYIKNR